MLITEGDQIPRISHMLISRDIHPDILGSCTKNKVFTHQGVHAELKERLSPGEKSIENHTGKANYDEYIMYHEDELKTLLVEEPIADPVPKKEPNEKDTMSFITEQKGSHSKELMKDLVTEELGATFLSKDINTKESPRVNVPYMQDQCLMIIEKVSSDYDELSEDQEVDQQSRS